MSTKKMAVKKKAPKKAAPKKAVKKAATKKVAVKKEVTKAPVKKAVVNKELAAMVAKIDEAKSQGKKSLVVYTTKAEDHKAESNSGFGVTDLKPKLLAAYKELFCKYNLSTKLVSIGEKKVDWIIKF